MTAPPQPAVVLASASPRRAELLEQIGVPFRVRISAIDETKHPDEDPSAYVERMARSKVAAVAQPGVGTVVLGADTAVICGGEVLGKPGSRADGLDMLGRLSGTRHDVLTAVAAGDGERLECTVVSTRVWFRSIAEAEALRYWHTGEPADKAGGYGIQGIGSIFALKIEGSYSAVVGLPLAETERLLVGFGVDTWRCRRADG